MATKLEIYIRKRLSEGADARTIATDVLNLRIKQLTGLSLDDLPDTSVIADTIDNLECSINDDVNMDDIRFEIINVNLDYVNELVFY